MESVYGAGGAEHTLMGVFQSPLDWFIHVLSGKLNDFGNTLFR